MGCSRALIGGDAQAVVHVEALVQCEDARQQYMRLKQAYGSSYVAGAV